MIFKVVVSLFPYVSERRETKRNENLKFSACFCLFLSVSTISLYNLIIAMFLKYKMCIYSSVSVCL